MNNNQILIRNEQQEHTHIRQDTIFAVILSALFFVILVALYFFNRATGQVDAFFSNLLKF